MKKIILIISLFSSSLGFAQVSPIDFEANGQGASWTWTVFENDTNPSLEIVDNPDASGANTSGRVAKFTATAAGMAFAGVESMHGADIGTFTIDNDNAFVKIWVWKSVISDVGIKFATPSGGSTGEIKVANTRVNEWEALLFDFTGVIGIPETINVDQIIVFPDFRDRNADETIYFDNITFGDSSLSIDSARQQLSAVYPNPANDILNVTDMEVLERIQLYDLQGRQLIDLRPKSNAVKIDVSFLSKGIYLTTLTRNGSQQTIKWIKK